MDDDYVIEMYNWECNKHNWVINIVLVLMVWGFFVSIIMNITTVLLVHQGIICFFTLVRKVKVKCLSK